MVYVFQTTQNWSFHVVVVQKTGNKNVSSIITHVHNHCITHFILQTKQFLKCDWLRPVVFKPNLKYLHVKITTSYMLL